MEEEIFECGVDRAAAGYAAARARGATDDDLRRLVAWWRRHRSGISYPEVALYRRLLRWRADQPIDEGWPMIEGYHPPKDREATRRKRAEEIARAEQSRERGRLERERSAARAKAWAALGRDACERLLDEHTPGWRDGVIRDPTHSMLALDLNDLEVVCG